MGAIGNKVHSIWAILENWIVYQIV